MTTDDDARAAQRAADFQQATISLAEATGNLRRANRLTRAAGVHIPIDRRLAAQELLDELETKLRYACLILDPEYIPE